MPTCKEALLGATGKLRAAGIDQPWFEAQLLLAATLKKTTVEIIAHGERSLSASQFRQFTAAVRQRQQRKPLAYIVGSKHFLHWDFAVNQDVLVPRPETELLVELAVRELRHRFPEAPLQLADIGTGSGVIGLSMLALLPSARLAAVDLSEPALLVARKNARRMQVQDRVTFYPGDLLQPLAGWKGSINCLTANLPYVASVEYENLQPEILRFEPREALVSGVDGLRHYRRLLREAKNYLCTGGLIFIEVGSTQGEQVQRLFIHGGFESPQIEKDLAGHERIVWAAKD